MSNGSCSLQTCVFTRRSTQASSPTAVISAPVSSPTTLCCMLTRGPTPKRSLSAESTVKKLLTTVGTSVVTLWARALHVPRVSPAFCSLGCLKSHQETHSEPLTQESALRSKSFLLQEGNSQWFVTSVTQRVDNMGRASEDFGSRGFHLHEWGGYLSDGLSFPWDFVFYFSVPCFKEFLLSFVILLLKACLISYQYFIMKLSLLLTAFLLGRTSL